MDPRLESCQGALARLATRDEEARRRFPEEEDPDSWLEYGISPFRIDACLKLLPCEALRRSGDKTQVRPGVLNMHIRKRLTHALEVAGLAFPAASLLGLNADLTLAIALGHDIGHMPFGHTGEQTLSRLSGKKIRHEVLSVVIAQKVERRGYGLNLTYQTLCGLKDHSRGDGPFTLLEGASQETDLVMYTDKIGYLWADFSDIFGRGWVDLSAYRELADLADWFGKNQRERTARCFRALCLESAQAGRIIFEKSEEAERLNLVRKWMYKVYNLANGRTEVVPTIERVYEMISAALPEVDPVLFVALLSDSEMVFLDTKKRLAPEDLKDLSSMEILAHLEGRKIDLTDPDLNW